MVFYTGDLHGHVQRILDWFDSGVSGENRDIYLLVLGDAGLNYYLDERDGEIKKGLQEKIDGLKSINRNVNCLFIRGNHECRPENIKTYVEKKAFSGTVYMEEEYPDLLFLKDGEIYEIENQKILTLGGGYSKDFMKRLLRGEGHWFDEQLSEREFEAIIQRLSQEKLEDFYVASHMLPASVSPEKRMEFSTKTRTEYWMETILQLYRTKIKKWISGHYHINWESEDGQFEIIYKKIKELK